MTLEAKADLKTVESTTASTALLGTTLQDKNGFVLFLQTVFSVHTWQYNAKSISHT